MSPGAVFYQKTETAGGGGGGGEDWASQATAHVTGFKGGPQWEVGLLLLVGPLSLLLRNTAVPWVFIGHRFAATNRSFLLKFFLDAAILVMPTLLAMTLLSERIFLVILLLIIGIATLVLFSIVEYCTMVKERVQWRAVLNQIIEDQHSPTIFVSYFRAAVLVFTAVAILAVDFRVFPRRFAKTEWRGHSVMDVGVAAFVYMAALVRPLAAVAPRRLASNVIGRPKKSWFSFLWGTTAILVGIGLTRTVVLKVLNRPLHVSEYGTHWNFFYTLAVVRMVSKVFTGRFNVILGLMFAGLQQYLHSHGFEEWLLDDGVPRTDWITANREGIFSLPGYLALFFFASAVGKFVALTGIRVRAWLNCTAHLVVVSAVFFALQVGAEWIFGEASRRTCNVAYVFAQLAELTLMLSLMLLVQLVTVMSWTARLPHFASDESPWERLRPCLYESLNALGFQFFILANLLTGLVNVTMNPLQIEDPNIATGIIVVYMFVACGAIHSYENLWRKRS